MSTAPLITIDIVPGLAGDPPMVRTSACTGGIAHGAESLLGNTDTAMVARAMLSSAAYLFAQGQPVKFGPEVPVEALK